MYAHADDTVALGRAIYARLEPELLSSNRYHYICIDVDSERFVIGTTMEEMRGKERELPALARRFRRQIGSELPIL